jgi:hypothetical protein
MLTYICATSNRKGKMTTKTTAVEPMSSAADHLAHSTFDPTPRAAYGGKLTSSAEQPVPRSKQMSELDRLMQSSRRQAAVRSTFILNF